MSAESEHVRIPTGRGHELAGIIDRPAAAVAAFAIFAHCFTCSKDSLAAARGSRALAERGIGVLRVDFTGLGDSEGDFGAGGIASDVADLEAAAAWLRDRDTPARILIGHSLGGAAVLAAAGGMDDVAAVVVINSPSDPAHVTRLLTGSRDEIESTGHATVEIGGRPFRIGRKLLEDLESHDLLADVAALDRPLLVMHSPTDNIVGIEHAAALFDAARHPRSFVSLDGVDHLLTRPEDAEWAAAVMAAWAARYVDVGVAVTPAGAVAPEPSREVAELAHGQVLVEEGDSGRFVQNVLAGRHWLVADEPVDVGGDDRGPNPYELLAAALGACTSMTLRMYADHKGWPLEHVAVRLSHRKVHAEDCADCASEKGKLDEIDRVITIEGDLDSQQRERLLEIASRCPVHRTLHEEVRVRSRLADDD